MFKEIKAWRTLSAGVVVTKAPIQCTRQGANKWRCSAPALWVLTWTVNPAGFPGIGKPHIDVVCDLHMPDTVRAIPFQYAGSLTIAPYKEVTTRG